MTDETSVPLPTNAEIFAIIIYEKAKRFEQQCQHIALSPHINGMKDGKVTYSTPSPDDNLKREQLKASWQDTQDDYFRQLASFGSVLPVKDPYSPHPAASIALCALRSNDPGIFKEDIRSIPIAENILLKVIEERQGRILAPII